MAEPIEDPEAQRLRDRLAHRYARLEQSRRTAPLIAIAHRFVEIDGLTQGGLLAIELFTTIIPLIILGFGYFTGFNDTANVGDLFVRQLGLGDPLDDRFRSAFGTAGGLESTWTVVGLAGFLFWGIPMSITVARMYARAWRREPFPIGQTIARGATWFVLYLATMIARQEISLAGQNGSGVHLLVLVGALVCVWLFWSLSPILLVRDGSRSFRALMIAGTAGVVIDGIVLHIAGRVAIPILLQGWTGFGPIGVAMTLMTWCGVLGIGWVLTACSGAVFWERFSPADIVVATESDNTLTSDQEPP